VLCLFAAQLDLSLSLNTYKLKDKSVHMTIARG
jgi:hypothetical protein